MKGKLTNKISFYKLQWDTDYFGINSAKCILHKPLTKNEWTELKDSFMDYHFVSIENRNSEPVNSQLIGVNTTAFLVDINIQFMKIVEPVSKLPTGIRIEQSMKPESEIIEMANFPVSKFSEDPGLAKRGGPEVYRHWLLNSFEQPDKYFALAVDGKGKIIGFLLHTYSESTCTVELIAVSRDFLDGGIGRKLFQALEYETYKRGCKEIKAGTQLRNMGAVNFYHKVGCKQIECHQVYHLWHV